VLRLSFVSASLLLGLLFTLKMELYGVTTQTTVLFIIIKIRGNVKVSDLKYMIMLGLPN
jgi:hypothetical protein